MSDERGRNKEKKYSNKDITVTWRPSKCIHVTTCYRELIEVFNPRKRPWINMQGASTDEIIRVVELCPTDALTFEWNDITKQKQVQKETERDEPDDTRMTVEAAEVRVMHNGPLLVKGKFRIVDSSGNELKQMKMATFCRCGQSKKMPFCDGTHRKINFSEE